MGNSFDGYDLASEKEKDTAAQAANADAPEPTSDAGAESEADAGGSAKPGKGASSSPTSTSDAGATKTQRAGTGGSAPSRSDAGTHTLQSAGGSHGGGSAATTPAVAGRGGSLASRGESEMDAGADEPLEGDVTLLPPMVPCQGMTVRQFPFDPPVDLTNWSAKTDSAGSTVSLSLDTRDGSPGRGALIAAVTLMKSGNSVQVQTVLDVPVSTTCMSVRLKVLDSTDNPDLSKTKAAWYLFAVDDDGCYAQSELPGSPWWYYDIVQSGVWYEASANTRKFVPDQKCTRFDPLRVKKLGVGLATSSSKVWPARFALDTIRAY